MDAVIQSFLTNVEREILSPLITLIALAAFIVFVWGVVDFVRNSASDEKRKTGQQHMIWGVIGLVIIFGANAIITLIKNTVGIP